MRRTRIYDSGNRRLRLSARHLTIFMFALSPSTSHAGPGRQQAAQRLHRTFQRQRFQGLDRRRNARPARDRRSARRRTREVGCRHEARHRRALASRQRRASQRRQGTVPGHEARLRRFRNVGRLEDQRQGRQRNLSARYTAGANLGSFGRKRRRRTAPTKAPARCGTTRRTSVSHPRSPTSRSASGTGCTFAWSARMSRSS